MKDKLLKQVALVQPLANLHHFVFRCHPIEKKRSVLVFEHRSIFSSSMHKLITELLHGQRHFLR